MTLISDVHRENKVVHDFYSSLHDHAVSYIRKSKNKKIYQNMLLGQMPSLKAINVLEIGCGTGTFCDFFLDKGVNTYHGVDLSPGMIEMAKKKFNVNNNVAFTVTSLEDLDESKQYDLIVSSSFLHHLFSLSEGLDKIKKLIAPGGKYIALHEPRSAYIMSTQDKLADFFDVAYMRLFGYEDWCQFSFIDRVGGFFSHCAYPFVKRFKKETHLSESENVNLVDYQLNFEFGDILRKEILSCGGQLLSYRYFHLLHLGNFMNTNDNYNAVIISK
jgi:SAM-dependent methyltransferase